MRQFLILISLLTVILPKEGIISAYAYNFIQSQSNISANNYNRNKNIINTYGANNITPINGAAYQITRNGSQPQPDSFFLKFYMTSSAYNYFSLVADSRANWRENEKNFTSNFFDSNFVGKIKPDWAGTIEEYNTLVQQLDAIFKPKTMFNVLIEQLLGIQRKWGFFKNIFLGNYTLNNMFWPPQYTAGVCLTQYLRQHGAVLELFFAKIDGEWGIYKYNTRIVPQTSWAIPFSYYFEDPYYFVSQEVWIIKKKK